MADERPGFLGRWARRKADALQGKPLDDEPAAPENTAPAAAAAVPATSAPTGPPEKLLSLDDVKRLTRDSDFKPFMAPNVGREVRNAAMKKLFTDPRYNLMDGLDTYIDDYSRPDPIPQAMLRQMAGAKLLRIFDEHPDKPHDKPAPETVARSGDSPDPSSPRRAGSEHPGQRDDDHAHPHLQLQPDHAPPAPDAGRGIG